MSGRNFDTASKLDGKAKKTKHKPQDYLLSSVIYKPVLPVIGGGEIYALT
jgi:hypothetical protein